ncbi:MAG TPA: enoyl-CoA hydratase-related protein [Bacteroidia bacterium]|nr:enoyl-CoA hydratase-related protein [Bacteroidia bacterium]HNT79724.1 enoyl-CoA hydratase-related protein [Bacteroidia bacterium]
MTYTNILFKKNASIATITLHRPDVINSVNWNLSEELQHALTDAGHDNDIRCIVLTGSGKGFCAGQDLVEATADNSKPIAEIVEKQYNPIIRLIRTIEKPIIAGVNGVAAGAGANIALACDIVVAAESAYFVQSFSSIGLIPDSAGTFFLPRLIGFQKAGALMITAEKVFAKEAVQMGMIYKSFTDDSFFEELSLLAKTIAARPTKGIGLTKRALNESLFHTLEQQLETEKNIQAEAAQSNDTKEGINAFKEKRKPVFTGS